MDTNQKKYIEKFYYDLRNNIERERTLKENSVFIAFMHMEKNSRYKALTKSSIPAEQIPNNILNFLLSENLIAKTDKIATYAITAKGVWLVEKEEGILDESAFLSYINKKKYVIEEKKEMTDKEKVILFSMLAARTFSRSSSIDLVNYNGVSSADKWKEILDDSCEKLISYNVIRKSVKDNLYGRTGNEHVINNLFRHNTELSHKIKGIYCSPGSQKYYLDIYEDSEISKFKLSYLFWRIFEGNLDPESIEDIAEFCNQISNDMSIYVFDLDEHLFSTPKYDIIVKDCLEDSVISKTDFERM